MNKYKDLIGKRASFTYNDVQYEDVDIVSANEEYKTVLLGTVIYYPDDAIDCEEFNNDHINKLTIKK